MQNLKILNLRIQIFQVLLHTIYREIQNLKILNLHIQIFQDENAIKDSVRPSPKNFVKR